jgi:hypothetical protein
MIWFFAPNVLFLITVEGLVGGYGFHVLKRQIIIQQDLDEDVVITLTAKNPQALIGLMRFDYTVGEYVSVKFIESMIDHLEVTFTLVFKDCSRKLDRFINWNFKTV